jgi:hypothetical protein
VSAAADLAPEWRRIDLLATCLSAQRGGRAIDEETKARLRQAQDAVIGLRRAPPWDALVATAGLNALDQDILACAAAPDAEPRLGWTYQELQPGVPSHYPSAALIRELLFVGAVEAGRFQARLGAGAPLRRLGLLDSGSEVYAPLRPTARARTALLGWPAAPVAAPQGALELPVKAGWDELVVPAGCRRGLRELLAFVTERDRVEHEWGARPCGGPVALFSGPSGTGKTFAAEVLAGALGFRLVRADLGLVVSKYVGETEKNLNLLLDAVAGQPVVLLFDEADSLFGRRGEIREARDRFANMEVSHLLSRIELHRGPCILTTNLRQNIDAAFLRRFHAVVEFPRPDAAARAVLWRLHLPPRAPRAAELDPERLGQAVALSGGQIRNAALRAALLASAEGVPIGPGHAARAVWAELAKEGRELAPSMLGALAEHLPEEAP